MHLSTNSYADSPADRLVAVARRRLAGRILDQAEDGLVPGTCMSSALESALALRLFQLEGVRTPSCEALVDYLHWAARPAGRRDFEQLVARWALDGGGADSAAVTGHLATVQHFSAGRKRVLALSVAKLLGAAPEPTVPK
ncbi:hypothetical protein, partial [Lentzea roselyniae]|uniref:hypothetical protein n=1 Tax=Lentzea roselyniae TaxID=531940 RepID=UPI0031F74D91